MSVADERPSRVPLVGDDATDPIVQGIYAGVKAKGGQPFNLLRAMANAPPVMEASRNAAYAIRYDAIVPRDLREIAIIRSSQLNGGTYEEVQHRPMALSCGLSLDQLDRIATWRDSDAFDPGQRAVLAYVDGMNREGGPTDAEFAALKAFLSDREIVELTYAACTYAGFSLFTRALRTPLDPGAGNPENPYGKS